MIAKIPKVNGCCFCLTTRNGSFILAGVVILVGISVFLQTMVAFTTSESTFKEIDEKERAGGTPPVSYLHIQSNVSNVPLKSRTNPL